MNRLLDASNSTLYIEYTTQIWTILLRYGHTFQAELAASIIEEFHQSGNPSCFVTTDLWGGMGSIIDCVISCEDRGIGSERENSDQGRFDHYLSSLARLLISDGIADQLVRARYQAFQLRYQ